MIFSLIRAMVSVSRPKLSQYEGLLKVLLDEGSVKPVRHHRSAQLLFEQLQRKGFSGGYRPHFSQKNTHIGNI